MGLGTNAWTPKWRVMVIDKVKIERLGSNRLIKNEKIKFIFLRMAEDLFTLDRLQRQVFSFTDF